MKKVNKNSNFKLTKNRMDSGFKVPMNYFNKIEDEIEAKLTTKKNSKENNFAIPDDYFESVEDIVLTKLKSEALKNKTTTIPDNYFNSIEDKVLNKLKSNKNTKLISLSKIITPIAIAASLLLIIYLNTFNNNTLTIDSISTAAIESYFEENQNNIDITSIASLYNENELNDESFDIEISNTEVENYLSEEDLENIIYEN
jgi:hypothetical protein